MFCFHSCICGEGSWNQKGYLSVIYPNRIHHGVKSLRLLDAAAGPAAGRTDRIYPLVI